MLIELIYHTIGCEHMRLHNMGISYRHGSGFKIERPNGSEDNLLLVFKSDAFVMLDGESVDVHSGNAMVFSRGCPQIYGSAGGIFENHWVHFECNEADIFFERIGFRFNCPLMISEMSGAEKVLKLLYREFLSPGVNTEECADLLLRLLIAKIGSSEASQSKSVHSEALRSLRAEIYRTPGGQFSVAVLAEKLLLSPSYFQTLYKAEFGISCYDDVLRAKMLSAEYYLKNTMLTVKEISELCGYANSVHFIRQFKQRSGMTATEYRESFLRRKGEA